jgi:hypothetical protein
MKFITKLLIISVVLLVIGLVSSNHHKSRVPEYEVPSILKNNNVIIYYLDKKLLNLY